MADRINFRLFLLLAAIALLFNAGSFGVVESSDARYAEIAREMYLSGDYLHPDLLNIHHYHKPPFTYQITALGYGLFGINAFGARFFLQIAVLIQLILVYRLTILLFDDKRTALWAAMVYFSFPIVIISSRNLTTDAFLTTFVLAAIYGWVKYRKNGALLYLYLFYLSLAMGFLTKGPVVFVVSLPFILFYNTSEATTNRFGFAHLSAFLLFLTVAASWYFYLVISDHNFLNYFIGKQTVERFATNTFNRHEPFWYFWAVFPMVTLPWSLALPGLLRGNGHLFTKRSIYTVLSAGIILPIIFFSLSSSKRVLYILPLFGYFAILIARLLTNISDKKAKNVTRVIFVYNLLIISFFIMTLFVKTDFHFSRFIGLAGILLMALTLSVYYSSQIELRFKPVYLTVIFALYLTVVGSSIMADNQLKINSPKPVTDFITEKQLSARDILVYNTRKPGIAFGLNKSIISLYDGSRGLERETQFEKDLNWKKYLINLRNQNETETLKRILEKPTVLIAYKHPLPERLNWLKQHYENTTVMGKWFIYY